MQPPWWSGKDLGSILPPKSTKVFRQATGLLQYSTPIFDVHPGYSMGVWEANRVRHLLPHDCPSQRSEEKHFPYGQIYNLYCKKTFIFTSSTYKPYECAGFLRHWNGFSQFKKLRHQREVVRLTNKLSIRILILSLLILRTSVIPEVYK